MSPSNWQKCEKSVDLKDPCSLKKNLLEIGIPESRSEIVREKGELGNTLLHLSAKQGSIDCAFVLLYVGADIYARNNNNETVLDVAIREDQYQFITWLFEIGFTQNSLKTSEASCFSILPNWLKLKT